MKDINKRKRKEYNKKAYQKRKTKKGETKAPKYHDNLRRVGDNDETETPEYREETKAPKYHEDREAKTGRLIKKSFTLNDKKFTLIDTEKLPRVEKNKTHSVLMASDRLLIMKIYNLYKAVKRLYDEDSPPALASPALVLLRDYLEEATTAHENGTPWAMNNYKEIKAFMKEIEEFLLV